MSFFLVLVTSSFFFLVLLNIIFLDCVDCCWGQTQTPEQFSEYCSHEQGDYLKSSQQIFS